MTTDLCRKYLNKPHEYLSAAWCLNVTQFLYSRPLYCYHCIRKLIIERLIEMNAIRVCTGIPSMPTMSMTLLDTAIITEYYLLNLRKVSLTGIFGFKLRLDSPKISLRPLLKATFVSLETLSLYYCKTYLSNNMHWPRRSFTWLQPNLPTLLVFLLSDDHSADPEIWKTRDAKNIAHKQEINRRADGTVGTASNLTSYHKQKNLFSTGGSLTQWLLLWHGITLALTNLMVSSLWLGTIALIHVFYAGDSNAAASQEPWFYSIIQSSMSLFCNFDLATRRAAYIVFFNSIFDSPWALCLVCMLLSSYILIVMANTLCTDTAHLFKLLALTIPQDAFVQPTPRS